MPVCIAYVCDILDMCYINKYLKYKYRQVKKNWQEKTIYLKLFSDICTVSDEAFGRLTIEWCGVHGWMSVKKGIISIAQRCKKSQT